MLCKYCGEVKARIHEKPVDGIRLGLYCEKCDIWLKWANKQERAKVEAAIAARKTEKAAVRTTNRARVNSYSDEKFAEFIAYTAKKYGYLPKEEVQKIVLDWLKSAVKA
jgi:hypothetical protein